MLIRTKSADNLINLNHAIRLTIHYRGKNSSGEVWSVIVFMAGGGNYMVLADYGSKEDAVSALSEISDALEVGKPVFRL